METIIFIAKFIGVIVLIISYFFFMAWCMSNVDRKQFNEVFEDATEKQKHEAKEIMRAVEEMH